jgi:hypothetical protein
MKIHLTIILVILFLSGLSSSCNSNPNYTDAGSTAMEKIASVEEAVSEEDFPVRKLIKEGHIEFETQNIEATREHILGAVQKYKGYVSADNEYKSPGRVSQTLTVRVPSKQFDHFLNDATQGVQHFDSKNINVQDVTEEFLDITARIKAKKELEARYLELLKLARSVSEMMEIERQLSDLRGQIESIEGRLKYLEKSVAFSTLNISFYKNIPNSAAFASKFKSGFRNGWENLVWFGIGLVNIWPFVLLFAGLIFALRRWRKKKLAQ